MPLLRALLHLYTTGNESNKRDDGGAAQLFDDTILPTILYLE